MLMGPREREGSLKLCELDVAVYLSVGVRSQGNIDYVAGDTRTEEQQT